MFKVAGFNLQDDLKETLAGPLSSNFDTQLTSDPEAFLQIAEANMSHCYLINLDQQIGLLLANRLAYLKSLANLPKIACLSLPGSPFLSNLLNMGIDHILVTPINSDELGLLLSGKMKRFERITANKKIIRILDLELDLEKLNCSHILGDNRSEINLTLNEFKILWILCSNPDDLFTREDFIQKIWANETHIKDRIVDTHISGLRKKLLPSKLIVETIYGLGYRIHYKEAINE